MVWCSVMCMNVDVDVDMDVMYGSLGCIEAFLDSPSPSTVLYFLTSCLLLPPSTVS